MFISGNGSNLQVLIDAGLPIALVVSNRQAAYGLVRAQAAGIPTLYFPLKSYRDRSREDYDRDLGREVAVIQPDLIVLAGWMHVLSPAFLNQFPEKVINLHPALPGAFPGINAIERAYRAYHDGTITHTGVMVHHVVPEVDAGPVIVQDVVPILMDDTLEDLEARVHETEHRLIVKAARML